MNYICNKCNFTTDYKSDFINHLNDGNHIDKQIKKTYKCKYCTFISTHSYNFKTHILNNHSTIDEKMNQFKYYCKVCDYGVFSINNYNTHLLTKKHICKSSLFNTN